MSRIEMERSYSFRFLLYRCKSTIKREQRNIFRLPSVCTFVNFCWQIYKKLPNGKLPKGNFYFSLTFFLHLIIYIGGDSPPSLHTLPHDNRNKKISPQKIRCQLFFCITISYNTSISHHRINCISKRME